MPPIHIHAITAALFLACGGHSTSPGTLGGGPGSATVMVASLGSGRGSVTASGSSFTCASGATCPLQLGGSVTLIANPDANSTFIGWEGGCAGSNCVVSPALNGATVKARFALNGYLSKVISGSTSDSVLYAVTPVPYSGAAVLAANWSTGTDYGDGKLVSGLVLARYDGSGALLQAIPFQGATSGATLVINQSGWFLVAGTFSGTLNIAGHSFASNGGTDVFWAMFNGAGTYAGGASYGGPGDDSAKGIAVDGYNNMSLLGQYGSTITFGTSTLTGGPATFVAKINSAVQVNWATTVIPPSSSAGYVYSAVACDQAGITYIAGNATAVGANALSIQALAYANGAASARLTLPGPSTTRLRLGSLFADPAGTVVFTGDFAGSMDFGAGTVTTPATTTSAIFLARYTASLATHLWSKEFMLGGNNDTGNAVVQDGYGTANGNIYLAGKLRAGSQVDFGAGPVTVSQPSGFLAEWSAAGAPIWSQIFTGGAASVGNVNGAVAAGVDWLNNVAVGGLLQGNADFGDAIRSSPGTSNALFWVKVPVAH